MFEGKSIWLVLLLTVLGGLALNLTPCVLPLIPINIAIIGAGAQAGSKTRGFFMGLAYGTGIALVYGGAGAVVVVTAGTFGAINASPWFNLSIAALFVFLGLAMFDVVTIDFTKYRSKIGVKRNEQGSFLVALFLGGVAALLAGACVAPVIIAVILFARNLYAQGAWAGLLLPFLLGVGMALPWPFAGAGLSFLPKPGKWMNRVKYVFGVFILGLAAYYAFLGYGLLQQRNLDSAHAPVDGAVSVAAEEGWHTSLAQGLQEALDENRPVLVDFWATWCKSCLTMDRTTFKEPRVIGALEDFVAVKYQAEDPKAGPTAAVLDHFGVVGLPTYVILEPKTGAK